VSRRVVVVVNPSAGKDEPILNVLSDVLGSEERGDDFEWDVRVTTCAEDAPRFAREAREAGAWRVLAYGGDGTVSAVADALAGGETALGILPGGTGNAVAQDLGVPLELRDAVLLAVDPGARVEAIDCLRVGPPESGRRFLLRLGIGADAGMIDGASREAKDRLGWLAYLVSAWDQMVHHDPAQYTVELDGRKVEFEALAVICANIGRIGRGGITIAQSVDPTDGEMDVFAIRDANPASILAVGASVLGLAEPGDLDPDAPLVRWRARRVKISSEPARDVQGDGEPFGTTPLDIELEPAAVRLVLP